jgi:hypothetical protein
VKTHPTAEPFQTASACLPAPGGVPLGQPASLNTPPAALLVATIFLSAFLLFQVQLIVAKHLLSWFGGAPAVWTTCQLFFQTVLLGGYAYAHVLGRLRSVRRQRSIHIGLIAAGVIAVVLVAGIGGYPVIAPAAMKPTGAEEPVGLLLFIMLSTVGLPFLVLSATSPLLQRWHSRTTASLDRTYRLYAVSNAGSLLGLLSYPFGVEWLLAVPAQAWLWGTLFLVFAVGCTIVTWKATSHSLVSDYEPADRPHAAASHARPPATPARAIWLWLILPLLSSGMLLATTNQLCQEVATVPFLWVLPLTLYLLTFIVCFDRPRSYSRRGFLVASAASTLLILPVAHLAVGIPISYQIVAYSLLLTCFCMVWHGELARLRPPAAELTRYYLLIALGGVLGALFVSMAAPALFPDFWEFHVLLFAGWLVFALAWRSDRESPWHRADRWILTLFVAAAGTVLLYQAVGLTPLAERPWTTRSSLAAVAGSIAFFSAAGCWAWRWQRLRAWPSTGLLIVLVIAMTGYFFHLRIEKTHKDTIFRDRNFFGVVRILEAKSTLGVPLARVLMHGNIIHGIQLTSPRQQQTATAYFSVSSGIGRAAQSLTAPAPDANPSRHWGIVGMGIGTLAVYAKPGDRVRLYEINPIVMDASEGPNPAFTFVRDCEADVTTVLGDARLALERELAKEPLRFDLLAMDAFSGDSVPVHLITEEAFRLYAAHLRSDQSILAVNITNLYLELEPVIAANAGKLGMFGVRLESAGDPPAAQRSTWILLARDRRALEHPAIAAGNPTPLGVKRVPFTDQYSNLFRVLK